MRRINCVLSGISILFLISCGKTDPGIIASGNFEATEVLVSSEASGRILRLDLSEGEVVREEQVLGEIDSLQLRLRRQQLLTGVQSVESRLVDLPIQTAALVQQLTTLEKEKERVKNLLKANAANQKALDDVTAQIALLRKQLEAQKTTIMAGNSTLENEKASLELQIAQLDDLIAKSLIISPREGTVLVTYAERGELAVPGKALFKLADLTTMIFRAYITADQLAGLALGQQVTVLADFGTQGDKAYPGTVGWISGESEFTPKTIQTRDERANLVYAVKVAVPNDGYLKIGMYGSLRKQD